MVIAECQRTLLIRVLEDTEKQLLTNMYVLNSAHRSLIHRRAKRMLEKLYLLVNYANARDLAEVMELVRQFESWVMGVCDDNDQ
jgi:hypothetical protein